MFNFNAKAGLSAEQSDNDTSLDEELISEKSATGTTTSNGTTVNSGSVNTGSTVTKNSGSTNTSNTKTDASVNTSVTGPSSSTVTNSGSVNTSQLMLSTDAVTHLVNQMLSSNQGLAAVVSGQKTAGGYNASANELLVNDLLARTAGEVASRAAITKQIIGGSTSTTNNSGVTTTQEIGATNSNTTQQIGGSTSVSDVLNIIGGSTSSTSNTATTNTNERTEGQTHSYKMEDLRNTKESTEGGGSFGWIICTELLKQGKINKKFYAAGLKIFQNYKDEYKRGYYIWGVPCVRHIRKHPDSLITKFIVSFSNARIEYLAAQAGYKRARKTVYGFLTTYVLYYLCVGLALTVARNYTITSAEEAHNKEVINGQRT